MESILVILRGWIFLLTFLEVEFQTLLRRAGNLPSFRSGVVQHGALRYLKSRSAAGKLRRLSRLLSLKFKDLRDSCEKIHVK